jgi:hydroxypyruvate isomerase
MTRRSFFPAVAAGAAAAAAPPAWKGRLKQSATRSCFGKGKDLEQICKDAAAVGLKGVDLIGPADWPLLKKYGLVPTMGPGGSSIRDGINKKENHDAIDARLRENINLAAQSGVPNLILLSGERKGTTDEAGIDNAAAFFNKVKAQAEDKGINLCLELLNSKVNHPDYHCDRTWWGVEVCRRVNSPRVKLLYDIYHMQIMEGDIIATIRKNMQWIGHFHTAGVPGRHEIDDTQELNYRAIAQAIVEAGFTGYFAHEYSPLKDPLASLEQAIRICDV